MVRRFSKASLLFLGFEVLRIPAKGVLFEF